MNKAKVDVGQSPPLDLVSAQAEVAANQEQLIIAETAVKQAEDRLRLLIFDPTAARDLERQRSSRSTRRRSRRRRSTSTRRSRARWRTAPTSRARARTSRTRRRNVKYAGNQRLPDVRAERQLPGERPRRHAGAAHRRLPGHHRRARARSPPSGPCSNQLFTHDYPTWAVGVSVSYPLGQSAEEANYARAKLEHAQAERAAEERRGARDPAGARRRLEDRDERQAHRDHAGRARTGRAAAGRRAEAVRSRACRRASWSSRRSAIWRRRRPTSCRPCWLRPVARRLRSAAGSRAGRDRYQRTFVVNADGHSRSGRCLGCGHRHRAPLHPDRHTGLLTPRAKGKRVDRGPPLALCPLPSALCPSPVDPAFSRSTYV